MQIVVRVHGPTFSRYLAKCLAAMLIFCIGVFISICEDEEAYLYLFNTARQSIGETLGKWDEASRQTADVKKSRNSSGTDTDITLNLDLIDDIKVTSPKRGYIKELLTLCRDAQEGKITTGSKTIPITCPLGMHVNEVSETDGCPRFYFSPGQWVKDSKNYSFAGFTSNSTKSMNIDGSGGKSVMQWIHSDSDFKARAKIDPAAGNSRKYQAGDIRFYPDYLEYLSQMFSEKKKEYTYVKDENSLGGAVSMTNSRGNAGVTYLLSGIAYAAGTPNVSFKWPNTSKKMKSYLLDTATEPFLALNADMKASRVFVGQEYCYALAAMVNSESSDQWFINQNAYNFVIRNGYVSLYKKVYGYQHKSDSTITNELKNHVAVSLAASIRKVNPTCSITESVTRRVYGTSGNYQDCPYYARSPQYAAYGYVWFVTSKKDTAGVYESAGGYSQPYHVMGFDGISFRYLFASMTGGQYEYAKLLKEAGVRSVDPADSKTYMNQSAAKPTTKQCGNLSILYKNASVNQDALNENRINILNIAAKIAERDDFIYLWGGSGRWYRDYYPGYGTVECYGLDCAQFVRYVYEHAGFSPGYHTTASLINAPLPWIEIKPDSIKPGDIIVNRNSGSGHTEIYVSGKLWNDTICIGAHGRTGHTPRDSISLGTKGAQVWTRRSRYKALRIPAVDTKTGLRISDLPRKRN